MRVVRSLNSRQFLWLLLAVPALYLLIAYARGDMIYGEVVHASGETGARLLILTLAVTPLRLMFPEGQWTLWLMRQRRYLGLAAFGYALLHALVYIQRHPLIATLIADAMQTAMWTGWLALLIMLPLAVTSHDWWMRLLRRDWKRLHRWVYAAAVLTALHWVLSAFNPVPGAIHFAVLLALETYRIWKGRTAAVRLAR